MNRINIGTIVFSLHASVKYLFIAQFNSIAQIVIFKGFNEDNEA